MSQNSIQPTLPDLNEFLVETSSQMFDSTFIHVDPILSPLANNSNETISRVLTCRQSSKPRLTNAQRRAIFDFLICQINGGTITKGLIELEMNKFSSSRSTIYRIWHAGIQCLKNDCPVDVSTKLPMRVGRKRVQIDFSKISKVPLRNRTNIRSLSVALKMSKSTVHRRIKELSEKYYLHPQEEDPLQTCKSKRFITKVMFLVAIAKPRINVGNVLFDGKIGVFPFIFKEPAKRNSKNRVAGTLETKVITNVTKDVLRSCLIQKVLPAIREKWPEDSSRIIHIQQDNARPHISVNDSDFLEEACKDGFDIRLRFQPPNNPDLNVLDLGFFRAIQCLQHEQSPTNIDELVCAVNNAFKNLPPDLDRVFITLQSCMLEIMKAFGGFNYKIPHMNMARLILEGILPRRLECDKNILNEAVGFLDIS